MNLNKVFILGRLTADPQLRSTASAQPVASFSVATNRIWNDKNGQRQKQVEFHNIVVWGRQAEIASQFLGKGGLVLVEGRLQTRNWVDKEGQQRKTTEIIAERFQLGPKSSSAQEGVGAQNRPARVRQDEDQPAGDEEVNEPIPTINVDDEIKSEDLPF